MNDPHHRSDAIAALEEYNTEYKDDDDDDIMDNYTRREASPFKFGVQHNHYQNQYVIYIILFFNYVYYYYYYYY